MDTDTGLGTAAATTTPSTHPRQRRLIAPRKDSVIATPDQRTNENYTATRHPRPSTTAVWTAARIRALGTVTTVPTAAAIFGLSRSVAYDLIRAGTFPVPVLRFGTRYRIPVAGILTALQMPLDPDHQTDLASGTRHASINHVESEAAHRTRGRTRTEVDP